MLPQRKRPGSYQFDDLQEECEHIYVDWEKNRLRNLIHNFE